jgi:hypothetical protein
MLFLRQAVQMTALFRISGKKDATDGEFIKPGVLFAELVSRDRRIGNLYCDPSEKAQNSPPPQAELHSGVYQGLTSFPESMNILGLIWTSRH